MFEFPDLDRERGLRDIQRPGRTRETAVSGGGKERMQVPEFDVHRSTLSLKVDSLLFFALSSRDNFRAEPASAMLRWF
jgi:hypothetical protein